MKKPFYKVLYVQVLAAIVIGVLLGFFFPDIGASMKPLGDGFIKLIKKAHCPGDFLYGGHRYCRNGRHEESRQGRRHCPSLL